MASSSPFSSTPQPPAPGAVYTPLQQHAAASDPDADEGSGASSLVGGGGRLSPAFKPFGVGRARPPPSSSTSSSKRNGDGTVPLLQLEEGGAGATGAAADGAATADGGRDRGDGPLLAPPQRSASLAAVGAAAAAMNQAPMWSCVAVLANNMMGAGTLGLPYGVAQTGWLVGGLLLVLSCALSAHGLHLLTLAARTAAANHHHPQHQRATANPASFQALCRAALPRWAFLVDLAIAIKCFGVAVSYLVIVGDLMPLAAREWAGHAPEAAPASLAEERWPWVLLAFVLVAPLSFAQRLTALKYTAGLSVGIVLGLALVALLYAGGAWNACGGSPADGEGMCRGTYAPGRGGVGALKVLPIFVFAYTCHQNFPLLLNELAAPTDRRVQATVGSAAGLSLATYLVIAQAAYWTYGSETAQDILQSFPPSGLVTWLRAAVSLLVTFTFPLQAHPARTCILNLWAGLSEPAKPSQIENRHQHAQRLLSPDHVNSSSTSTDQSPTHPSDPPTAPTATDSSSGSSGQQQQQQQQQQTTTTQLVALRYSLVTLLFLCAALLVALLVDDLSLVLEIVGATGSTIVSYLLPGAAYARLHPWPHPRRALARAQFALGLVVIPVGLTSVFLK